MSDRHVLVVETFDPDNPEDQYAVEHPIGCPADHYGFPMCGVAYHMENEGLGSWFVHKDDTAPAKGRQPVATGRHLIEVWKQRIRTYPAVEHETGLRLVADQHGTRGVDTDAR